MSQIDYASYAMVLSTIKDKDRYIAALEARIDTLQKDKQNAALEYLSLEGQCREMSAELIELRELVGVHNRKRK